MELLLEVEFCLSIKTSRGKEEALSFIGLHARGTQWGCHQSLTYLHLVQPSHLSQGMVRECCKMLSDHVNEMELPLPRVERVHVHVLVDH